MELMKLGDVVTRARLNLSTVQYILKNPETVPGLPDAGSQGVHREFNEQQAFQLAFCALLVMGGMPLRHAGALVVWCDAAIRRVKREHPEHDGPDYGRRLSPWTVKILDGEYVELVGWGERVPSDKKQMYSITQARLVPSMFRPLMRQTIDLANLWRLLRKPTT